MRELGRYFTFRFSLFAKSPASIRYLATCLTIDSLVSPKNFINFGTFHLEGNYDYIIYSDSGDVQFGLWRPTFTLFRAIILSTMAAKFLFAAISLRQT